MSDRGRTHWNGCHAAGRSRYACALAQIKKLKSRLRAATRGEVRWLACGLAGYRLFDDRDAAREWARREAAAFQGLTHELEEGGPDLERPRVPVFAVVGEPEEVGPLPRPGRGENVYHEEQPHG